MIMEVKFNRFLPTVFQIYSQNLTVKGCLFQNIYYVENLQKDLFEVKEDE